jgi:hypothetical protein
MRSIIIKVVIKILFYFCGGNSATFSSKCDIKRRCDIQRRHNAGLLEIQFAVDVREMTIFTCKYEKYKSG